ncbi:MAG: hypothetical protein KGJ78_00165 [Alphaproteobacteria bacterium]|nr:hypothetical protein [Alphaproteobacteria bacterium]
MGLKAWKTAALAGLFGVGAMVAMATSASAHYSYVRCDSDGDTCWRVVCDDDGDDCNRVRTFHRSDYDRGGYWNGIYGDGFSFDWSSGDRDQYYRGRHWTCDSDGDRCHWADDDD